MACGRGGDPGRLWVVADAQSGGRGRNGRIWWSPPGNLYASLLLIDPAPPRRAAELGFVVSLALARALREILAGDVRLAIKWPNDILHDGAKLAGILLESAMRPDGRMVCVAGIGVNCARHPDDALYPATNLGAAAGRPIAPEAVFESLAAAVAHWLAVWAEGAGFAAIRAEWLALATGLGARIKVARASETLEGVFRTIDATGRLMLEGASGQIAVEAGDVFLAGRPINAGAAGS